MADLTPIVCCRVAGEIVTFLYSVRKTDFKKIFGTTVRDWRKQRGISQEELAERADLHRTYVCDVERGARNVSLESIQKLAFALKISVAALFPPLETQHGKASPANGNGQGKDLVDILLVEDNADDVELTLRAFKKARIANRVHVIGDGVEALDYLLCRGKHARRSLVNRPQVILLDLNLPGLSGLEVLRGIKADKRTRMIPVVILTGSDNDLNVTECRRLGAEAYVLKPVNFQAFSMATPQLKLSWALLKPAGTNGRIVRA